MAPVAQTEEEKAKAFLSEIEVRMADLMVSRLEEADADAFALKAALRAVLRLARTGEIVSSSEVERIMADKKKKHPVLFGDCGSVEGQEVEELLEETLEAVREVERENLMKAMRDRADRGVTDDIPPLPADARRLRVGDRVRIFVEPRSQFVEENERRNAEPHVQPPTAGATLTSAASSTGTSTGAAAFPEEGSSRPRRYWRIGVVGAIDRDRHLHRIDHPDLADEQTLGRSAASPAPSPGFDIMGAERVSVSRGRAPGRAGRQGVGGASGDSSSTAVSSSVVDTSPHYSRWHDMTLTRWTHVLRHPGHPEAKHVDYARALPIPFCGRPGAPMSAAASLELRARLELLPHPVGQGERLDNTFDRGYMRERTKWRLGDFTACGDKDGFVDHRAFPAKGATQRLPKGVDSCLTRTNFCCSALTLQRRWSCCPHLEITGTLEDLLKVPGCERC